MEIVFEVAFGLRRPRDDFEIRVRGFVLKFQEREISIGLIRPVGDPIRLKFNGWLKKAKLIRRIRWLCTKKRSGTGENGRMGLNRNRFFGKLASDGCRIIANGIRDIICSLPSHLVMNSAKASVGNPTSHVSVYHGHGRTQDVKKRPRGRTSA